MLSRKKWQKINTKESRRNRTNRDREREWHSSEAMKELFH